MKEVVAFFKMEILMTMQHSSLGGLEHVPKKILKLNDI